MTVFIQDTSTQTTSVITANQRYTTKAIPNISFNGTSGIYNPAADNIKIFTNNVDALTIDSNQGLYGNGTGLTNIGYSNIINKPTNFQSDWTSTVINKPTNFQSDWTSTVINKPTNFQSDWTSTVINKPSTFPADMTNIYTKTEVNNIATLTNFYNKTTLDTTLAGKESVLTFSTPLTRTANTISIDLSAYQPILTFNSPMVIM